MRSLLAVALLVAFAAGCSGGPPQIQAGTPCTHCGMSVAEMRFACVRVAQRDVRAYDAIECLLAEDGAVAFHGRPACTRQSASRATWPFVRPATSSAARRSRNAAYPPPIGEGNEPRTTHIESAGWSVRVS